MYYTYMCMWYVHIHVCMCSYMCVYECVYTFVCIYMKFLYKKYF